ncbi:major capsid protein [Halodesulfovibrio spirochaetisodalis]|uniref:Uncharacterized protein n=1 Tax=Halodesulfovibrio spirochaetisodalis TaxID=1560234 RepID=A0A1B7XA10_9BACT|nr:hypothetical protein [Halodesulfovibrio spirochaetisodalis]OBQ46214.1 hypothetical protein SP90_13515 [Halodesulfovibrio spirochaetisodalis]
MGKDFLMGTLKELSNEHCKKQPHQVDTITEEAPILGILPLAPSSHELWHNHEELSGVQGAGWVPMNAPLPAMSVSADIKKTDLAILGGEIEVPQDRAKAFGGKEKYFAKKLPKTQRESGMSAETAIIYNNFLPYAHEHNKVVDAGASGDGYSMIAVTFTQDELCGLYSPAGFKMGAIMDVEPINNGGLYKDKDGVLVYGIALKAYMGLLLANPKKIAAIRNIDKEHKPTADMIDNMLADCRASNSSNTYIFCHPKCQTLLNEHKGKSMQTTTDTKNINRTFTHWNGVEIQTSFNFMDGTEQHVDL